jgi:hypothetical protein
MSQGTDIHKQAEELQSKRSGADANGPGDTFLNVATILGTAFLLAVLCALVAVATA